MNLASPDNGSEQSTGKASKDLTRREALKSIGAMVGAAAILAACGEAAGSGSTTTTAGVTTTTAAATTTSTTAATTTTQWTVEKVTIGASTTSVNHLWAQWGVKQGIYEKHFLDVEVIDNLQDPVAALVAGQVDFIANGTPTFAGAVDGAPIRSQMITYRDNYAIMVDPSITSIEQLAGKSIIGGNDVMKAAVLSKGVDPTSITWVTSRGTASQNIDLVLAGEADGVAGFPPLRFLAEAQGLTLALITSEVFTGAPVSNTAANLDTMQNRPDLVKRVIAANLETLKHLRENKPMVIEFFTTEWEQDEELAEKSYGVIETDMFQTGKTNAEDLQAMIDVVALAQGKTEKVLWTDVFDFTHLDDVTANPGKY